ncbi:MAG TPA: Na+/H+ antiporter NhaA [Rhizomicrobium sp.]|jgi:NhaA family Na+:H+ antiporter|nr:Na+/H+ antiporter NhaA [Rhizomicrobium sp.]
MANPMDALRLRRAIDPSRDHVRGGGVAGRTVRVVSYSDFLCPYCQRFRTVLKALRQAFGERIIYAFRHFPNERSHPGADFAARAAEAAANQDKFWEFHDLIYDEKPPFGEERIRQIARDIGLDMERFERDLNAPETEARVASDLAEGRRNGVTGTPTLFVDGVRYDGAWDFYSLADAFEQPVSERISRSARAFASLPASGGLVLLLAAALALICANSPLAGYYHALIGSSFGIGPPGSVLSLTIGEWFSEGLLAVFFLLVGLEIRREMTAGTLSDFKAALLPVVAAVGGGIAPALVYLLFNQGATAHGWAVPTATDIAFVLGVLALLGDRVSTTLRVFIAAFAVVDDILSVLTLAVFYPHNFEAAWLIAAAVAILALYCLNRGRVYAAWPYLVVSAVLWFCLHSAGVHGALAGVVLAAFVPTRPTPDAAPLLAQAATALSTLDYAQREAEERGANAGDENPALEWASRNLSAASERLLSPADRIERAVAPWSTYLALPLFAFSAAGVGLSVDLSSPDATKILLGVILGLVIGKPLGICIVSAAAIKTRIADAPKSTTIIAFIGAASLCGIGDTVALLMADQAFPHSEDAAIAKIAVLIGSALAAVVGATIIMLGAARNPADERAVAS